MNLTRNWRRLVGGVAFVLAVGWVATRGVCKSDSAEAAIRFHLGETGAEVRSLRAELHRGDDPEVLAYWEKSFDERGSGPVAGPWRLRVDSGLYRVEVVIRTATASGVATRSIDLRDAMSITVDLTDALSPASGPLPVPHQITGDDPVGPPAAR